MTTVKLQPGQTYEEVLPNIPNLRPQPIIQSTQPAPGYVETWESIRSKFGAPTLTYTPAYDSLAQNLKPKTVSYTPQTLFDNQKESIKNALRQEFFGPLGVAQGQASEMTNLGIGDSGVGKTFFQETVTRPFADSLAQAFSQVDNSQIADIQRINELNAQAENAYTSILAQAQMLDSQNLLEAQTAAQNLNAQLDQIAVLLANGEIDLETQELESLLAALEGQLLEQKQEFELATTVLSPSNEDLFADTIKELTADQAKDFAKLYPWNQEYWNNIAKQIEEGKINEYFAT